MEEFLKCDRDYCLFKPCLKIHNCHNILLVCGREINVCEVCLRAGYSGITGDGALCTGLLSQSKQGGFGLSATLNCLIL